MMGKLSNSPLIIFIHQIWANIVKYRIWAIIRYDFYNGIQLFKRLLTITCTQEVIFILLIFIFVNL